VFDPAQDGTAEDLWGAALDAAPSWAPPTDRLLVVSPHPDDEVFGAGGVLRAWVRSGRSVTLLSVTDGEAAYPNWPDLDRVRRAELERALETLCGTAAISTRTAVISIRLRIPDGRVAENTRVLREALEALAEHDTTVVAPYEADGHADHDAAGAVCREFARSAALPLARYPIWAWHHLSPASMPVMWGKFHLDPPARRAKAAAARCFVSQIRPHRRAPVVPGHVLNYFQRSYEAFVL